MAVASIKHRGLKQLFEDGDRKGVPAEFADKLQRMLTALHHACSIDDIGLVPGWRLHPLKGDLKGHWSLTVTPQLPADIPVRWRRRLRFGPGGLRLRAKGRTVALTMKSPSHPGAIIREDVIKPLGLTVTDAAKTLGVARPTLSSLLNESAALTWEMAIRIEKAFGPKADHFMRIQFAYDETRARAQEKKIRVKRVPGARKVA